MTERPPVLYLLDPASDDKRYALIDDDALLRLLRGMTHERPTRAAAQWFNDPRLPRGEFPCGSHAAPLFNRRLADRFRVELERCGTLVPVTFGEPSPEYFLLVVELVVDCLDVGRSSRPKHTTGAIAQPVFVRERVPTDVPAFRFPQSPTWVMWNRSFVEELLIESPGCVRPLVLWSADPSVAVFPRAMR